MAKILSIRGVDEEVSRQFAAGAAVRGITQAEYLRRLLDLRESAVAALRLSQRTEPPLFSASESLDELRAVLTRNALWDHLA